MKYKEFQSKYNLYPKITIEGHDEEIFVGYEEILEQLRESNLVNATIVFETYPQVNLNDLLEKIIKPLNPVLIINSQDAAINESDYELKLKEYITDDRVFGRMSHHIMEDFFYTDKLEELRNKLNIYGLKVLYGVGSTLISEGDILIYCDLARWEIQKRYRNGNSNWLCNNRNEDILSKYKRGYFIEWRIADRHKINLINKINYLLDTNKKDKPKLLKGKAYIDGLKQTANKPFRLVPYFDSGVWGGQWMKEICHLSQEKINFAWCFDGVPEENSIYLAYGKEYIEIPAINLVLVQPISLLGQAVYNRFGAEFPIRFDLLDTMDGQNLSLQVHPISSYIKEQFGMEYTQDESYYILDALDNSCVYLGLKEGIDKNSFLQDLKRAKKGEIKFPDHLYINKFPAKKHDHFSIPAGTIHCSGSNTLVLEISATPYIFTFKLWDWDRVGLDGLPRPVHIEHGEKVIQYDRTTEWIKENLVNPIDIINENIESKEERTGLHNLEFIETRRHWFKEKVLHKTNGVFNMLNLVEGEEAIIESPTNAFDPYIVHYAETFIIPATINEYTIRPYGTSVGKEIATVKAYVRGE